MLNKGLSVNRNIPGDDSENYCATLFGMNINPNRTKRPDLISIPNTYDPNFSIETKSSANKKYPKGSLVGKQLRYSLTKDEEYIDKETGVIDLNTAFYYDVIHRTCGTNGKKYQTPYSAIKFTYGDQFFVPHKFVFNLFAITYARKTSNKTIQIKRRKNELNKLINDSIEKGNPLFNLLENRLNVNSNGWQDLKGRMIKAIVTDDYSKASKLDRFEIDKLKKFYEEFLDLKKMIIQGPNGNQIYCLYNPEHSNLFENQLTNTVYNNNSIIEELDYRRQQLVPVVSRFNVEIQTMSNGLRKRLTKFANGGLPSDYYKKVGISLELQDELERLCKWQIK